MTSLAGHAVRWLGGQACEATGCKDSEGALPDASFSGATVRRAIAALATDHIANRIVDDVRSLHREPSDLDDIRQRGQPVHEDTSRPSNQLSMY